jgi:hypothetical protein
MLKTAGTRDIRSGEPSCAFLFLQNISGIEMQLAASSEIDNYVVYPAKVRWLFDMVRTYSSCKKYDLFFLK